MTKTIPYYTISEVAKEKGVNTSTVHRAIHQSKTLPHVTTVGGSALIRAADARKYISTDFRPGPKPANKRENKK